MHFGLQLGASGAQFLTFLRCFVWADFLEQKKTRWRVYLDDPAECAGPLGGRGVRNQHELRCGSSTPQAPLKRGRADSKRYAHSAGPVEQNKLLRKENSASQDSFHSEVCL